MQTYSRIRRKTVRLRPLGANNLYQIRVQQMFNSSSTLSIPPKSADDSPLGSVQGATREASVLSPMIGASLVS
jgi:hypothetical protein